MKDLPPELWAAIFKFALDLPRCPPRSNHPVFAPPPSPRTSPLLPASVCQLWRDVALSTAALWSFPTVEYSCHNASKQERKMSLSLFDLFLKRSRGYPLTCRIVLADSDDQQYLLSLLPHIHHWKHICIESTDFPAFDERFEQISSNPQQAPLLESLQMSLDLSYGDGNAQYIDWSSTILDFAPSMRYLDCSSELSVSSASSISPNLTHVRFSGIGIPVADALRILSQAPAIEEFSSGLITSSQLHSLGLLDLLRLDPNAINSQTTEYVTAPSLKRLEIRCCTVPAFIDHFYDALILPSLTDLLFGFQGHNWPQGRVHALLDRSGCYLRSLSISKVGLLDTQLLSVLQHPAVYNSLQSLDISECRGSFTDSVVHALDTVEHHVENKPSFFLPSLKTLSLHHCMEQHLGALSSAVQHRIMKTGQRDFRVFLTWTWPSQREDDVVLSQLKEDGLLADFVSRP